MGVGYQLVNPSKRELISFAHLSVSTRNEIVGNPVSAALATWYLFKNPGCNIEFVSDTYDDWPFTIGSRSEIPTYLDVTESLINELICEGILEDQGIAYADEQEPRSIYIRAIRNLWLNK
jgi:hypothetical protein